MKTVTSTFARDHLGALLRSVARGKSFIITRRGKPVALVSPVYSKKRLCFPDLSAFRAGIKNLGTPEVTIADLREFERY